MLPILFAIWVAVSFPAGIVTARIIRNAFHHAPRRDCDLNRVVREFAVRRRGFSFLHVGHK